MPVPHGSSSDSRGTGPCLSSLAVVSEQLALITPVSDKCSVPDLQICRMHLPYPNLALPDRSSDAFSNDGFNRRSQSALQPASGRFRSASSPTTGWSMPNSSCSDTPGRISPRLPRPQASFRPAISLGSSRPGRAFHPPTGAERSTEIDRFRNPRPAPDSPVFPAEDDIFLLKQQFFLPKQQNPRPRFSSFVFSVNFVLELFGPKPCFPSSKIPLLYGRPSEAKG